MVVPNRDDTSGVHEKSAAVGARWPAAQSNTTRANVPGATALAVLIIPTLSRSSVPLWSESWSPALKSPLAPLRFVTRARTVLWLPVPGMSSSVPG